MSARSGTRGTAIRGSEAGKASQAQRRKPGRVPTACAECRRLKLRCNRQIPCEKCESRGCAAICPDGVLTPGKGNRLVLANTEELHDKIDGMTSRVRLLERALRDLQSSVTAEPHPLLRSDLVLPSSGHPTPTPPPQAPPSPDLEPSSSHEPPPPQPSDASTSTASRQIEPPRIRIDDDTHEVAACGTLISTPNGGYLHLGCTARPEYLMRIPSSFRTTQNISSTTRLSKRIINTSFFDSDLQDLDEDLRREIYGFLPPLSEAETLCQVYLEHGKYLYISLSHEELSEAVTLIYHTGSYEGNSESLSLLFSVLALGAMLNQHPDSSRAQEYFYLSRAALSLSPPRCGTTLVYIQAVINMAQYLDLSNPGLSHSSSAWLYAGYAARLGQDIALQLNNTHWDLPTDVSLRRCRTFWRLFVLDTWTSFYYGRPLVLSAPFIDCPFPKDLPPEHLRMSFDLWNSKFASLVHSVATIAFGPKHVPYASIIELDRRIRDFHVPTMWMFQSDSETLETTSELHMRRYFVCARKEIVLLSLHRPYLVHILSERPPALLRHQYQASAAACYRSAWRLIHATKLTFQHEPHTTSRLSIVWSHCLSAIVVMSLLVTNDPKGPLGASALRDLEVAVELFRSAAASSHPALNLLAPVQKLLQTAREAAGQLSIARVGEEDLDAYPPRELERLAGKTTCPQEMTTPHSPWSLHDPAAQRPSATNPWQALSVVEEDPFQVLEDLAVQQRSRARLDIPQSQTFRQAAVCPHATLERDLRNWERGEFCIHNDALNDGPPIPPYMTSTSYASHIDSPSNTPRGRQLELVIDLDPTPSINGSSGYASTLSDRAFSASEFGLGMEQLYQSEQPVSSGSGAGPGAFGGLFASNAALMTDPSLQTIAEHIGFFSTPLSYNSQWFPSLSC